MPRYGQVIIGPPGCGKTTYCDAMSNYLKEMGRQVAIVNIGLLFMKIKETNINYFLYFSNLCRNVVTFYHYLHNYPYIIFYLINSFFIYKRLIKEINII